MSKANAFFLDWVGNSYLGTANVGSLCDSGSVVVFSVLFSLSLIQSGAKGKLVRSLAVCEESSPRPGAENLHDNQVHLPSLLLAAWLTSIFSCMIVLLVGHLTLSFLGEKLHPTMNVFLWSYWFGVNFNLKY